MVTSVHVTLKFSDADGAGARGLAARAAGYQCNVVWEGDQDGHAVSA
jgi:hypothetical protein